jgi:hypothetical protein
MRRLDGRIGSRGGSTHRLAASSIQLGSGPPVGPPLLFLHSSTYLARSFLIPRCKSEISWKCPPGFQLGPPIPSRMGSYFRSSFNSLPAFSRILARSSSHFCVCGSRCGGPGALCGKSLACVGRFWQRSCSCGRTWWKARHCHKKTRQESGNWHAQSKRARTQSAGHGSAPLNWAVG